MNITFDRHYYLFKGDWYEIFFQLLDMFPSGQQQKFEIWEPLDKRKDHNVILTYGSALREEYCFANKIWTTHEKIFHAFYMPKMDDFNIHSNQYEKNEEDENNSIHDAMNYHLPSSL